jgi:RNA-directed DNA polymerase
MGLFDFLRRLLLGKRSQPETTRRKPRKPRQRVRLYPLSRRISGHRPMGESTTVDGPAPPYAFAPFSDQFGKYFDFSQDSDAERLSEFGLPHIDSPETLALWLDLPLGKVAWLIHRFADDNRPQNTQQSHYAYRWLKKRGPGWRLIEAPKSTLKSAQHQILTELLDRIPPHSNAHGFVTGRSIITNAQPHVGNRVVVKFDLENFYATVSFSRVVAIYRSVGYCREVALWLARLTTSQVPANMPFPEGDSLAILPFLPRHLPQGAPTSPALANLSAFSLDLRLNGLARTFSANYTRYADDLTFSGAEDLLQGLPVLIPLVTKIVRSERFRINRKKRKVIRNNQCQIVTGVVVNEVLNISRRDFDRLKAILNNCQRHGPSTQNREEHPDFAAHLLGRVAHVTQINPSRGQKLQAIYDRIDWRR